jgi:hypothetical protein
MPPRLFHHAEVTANFGLAGYRYALLVGRLFRQMTDSAKDTPDLRSNTDLLGRYLRLA